MRFGTHHFQNIRQYISEFGIDIIKLNYEKASKNNLKLFEFGGQTFETIYAKYICILVDKHLIPEYEDYLEQKAIMQSEERYLEIRADHDYHDSVNL